MAQISSKLPVVNSTLRLTASYSSFKVKNTRANIASLSGAMKTSAQCACRPDTATLHAQLLFVLLLLTNDGATWRLMEKK